MAKSNPYIDQINFFIGKKIYELRSEQNLSRNRLAEAIGVTHQQLHKYEKGTNRISVGRLLLIALVLGKSMAFFCEGADKLIKQAIADKE